MKIEFEENGHVGTPSQQKVEFKQTKTIFAYFHSRKKLSNFLQVNRFSIPLLYQRLIKGNNFFQPGLGSHLGFLQSHEYMQSFRTAVSDSKICVDWYTRGRLETTLEVCLGNFSWQQVVDQSASIRSVFFQRKRCFFVVFKMESDIQDALEDLGLVFEFI